MRNKNVTRGYGLLERFLSKKRSIMANDLIPVKCRSGKILDIGCGTIPYFLLNTEFNEKFGLDPNLLEGKENRKNIILRRFDVEQNDKLPFNDNYFNIVTMLSVLEHINQDRILNILIEIRRVLKENGRFILTTPCPWTEKVLRIMANLKFVSSKEIEEHKALYNRSTISYFLKKAGFNKDNINFGYFELFMNNWIYVDKKGDIL